MIDMDRAESIQLLENARVGRLGMVDPRGKPYTIPLRFVWTNDAVYMRVAPFGRKGDALELNPHVCFEADLYTENFSEYASVVIDGTLVEVTDPVEKEEALFRCHEKYARLCGLGVPPRPVVINGVALRKLVVEHFSGRKKEPDPVPIKARLEAKAAPKAASKPRRPRIGA